MVSQDLSGGIIQSAVDTVESFSGMEASRWLDRMCRVQNGRAEKASAQEIKSSEMANTALRDLFILFVVLNMQRWVTIRRTVPVDVDYRDV